MFDVVWLRVQPDWVLSDALDAACDAIERGRLFGTWLLDALDYVDALWSELTARGFGHDLHDLKHGKSIASGRDFRITEKSWPWS
jgi:hypothetical protein